MKNLIKSKEAGVLLIFILLCIIITVGNSTFIRPDNIVDMLKSNIVLGIMAIGMLPVIITGGIDVSVSASVAAVTVIIGKFMVAVGGNLFMVVLVSCAAGIIFGLINGILISKLKIPPIVVTLGTMSVINGTMLYYTNGNWINDIPEYFINFGRIVLFKVQTNSGIVGIPIQIIIFIFVALLTWFVLKYAVIGRGIYALGGNAVSAQRIGYNLDTINIFVYGYMGLMVGIAAFVHTSIMKQVDPNAFFGFELQVIAAVVLGGANVLGGEGSVWGTIIGVLLLSAINNGLILMHIPVFWQKIVVGIIILLAVSFDVIQRKRSEANLVRVDIE